MLPIGPTHPNRLPTGSLAPVSFNLWAIIVSYLPVSAVDSCVATASWTRELILPQTADELNSSKIGQRWLKEMVSSCALYHLRTIQLFYAKPSIFPRLFLPIACTYRMSIESFGIFLRQIQRNPFNANWWENITGEIKTLYLKETANPSPLLIELSAQLINDVFTPDLVKPISTSLLSLAAYKGCPELFKQCLQIIAAPSARDNEFARLLLNNCMLISSRMGHATIVNQLLQLSNTEEDQAARLVALTDACFHNHVPVARLLIDWLVSNSRLMRNPEIGKRIDSIWNTAIRRDRVELIKTLMEFPLFQPSFELEPPRLIRELLPDVSKPGVQTYFKILVSIRLNEFITTGELPDPQITPLAIVINNIEFFYAIKSHMTPKMSIDEKIKIIKKHITSIVKFCTENPFYIKASIPVIQDFLSLLPPPYPSKVALRALRLLPTDAIDAWINLENTPELSDTATREACLGHLYATLMRIGHQWQANMLQ